MAASLPVNLLILVLLVSVCIFSGAGTALSQGCDLSSIHVEQSTTGRRQGFDSEFTVVVTNACSCAQRDVRLFAPGFVSQKPVDPALFRRDGSTGSFLVNGGNPLPPQSTIHFSYWWDHATNFSPAGSQPLCHR